MSDEEELACTVERVVYHDARSRYTVLRVLAPGHDTLLTAVGRMVAVEPGAELTLRGHWDEHPQHGRQFAIVGMKVAVPTTKLGIQRRLMRYPGVKAVMAARIVDKFGLDTLNIVEQQPRRLLEVEGIGARTLERIVEHYQTHSGPMAQIEAQLLELDLPVYLAAAIHERYGDDGINVLRKHPYRLAREVRGIGFATADRVARALGIEPDSAERLDAGLMHVLEQAELDGNCALPIAGLVEQAIRNLGAPEHAVRDAGERLVVSGEVVLEHGNDGEEALAFPARMVVAETDVAEGLAALARGAVDPWTVPSLPAHLSEGQVASVHAVAEHGVVVLTGGPGTGKSTVVAQVLELAQANDTPVLLAAPTGRAAKRLEQTTGHSASTLHRLLEFQPETGAFSHGPADPLTPALVVIDESSMVDVHLAAALVGALTSSHRLLLVGDADQLPSVGPGNVLRDIMAVAQEPQTPMSLVRLTEVFRQGEGSSIIANAHHVLHGQTLKPDPAGSEGEFFVVATRTAQRVHDQVVRMATDRIPAAYGLEGRTDVQVLVPMHKGIAGTENLNRSLQAHFTAGESQWQLGGQNTRPRLFRTHDRVMQTRNDYDKGVFNGDIGEVKAVDAEAGTLRVDFDGQSVTYEGREATALQLAYALSIHKSQGSEFDAVLVVLLPEHHVMLRRNLLYTAITRAKKLCVVVGDPRAIERAIDQSADSRRHTALARRLREAMR